MRKTVWAALVASTFALPAAAVSVDSALSTKYLGVAGGYEISDNDRDAKNGVGVQITFGVPLNYANGAIELNYWDVRRDRALDGELDFQTSLMVNYVQDLGSFSIFKPYATVGIGGVQEDVLGEKRTHAAVDAGIGTLIALPWHNLAIRTEARALGQDNESKSAPGNEDFITDYRIMLGLQVPLLLAAAPATPGEAPAAIDACDVKVVNAEGRSDCASDSDKDGVADGTDQCPGTESGIPVNEVGCPQMGEAVSIAAPAPAAMPDAMEMAVQDPAVQYITFSDNRFTIDDESKSKLDALSRVMANNPGMRVEIEGRTDNRGSEAYNIVLGTQRAEAVRQYLLAKGVTAANLTAISLGEARPVASNDTAQGRKENRSVRFRLIK